MPKGYVLVTEEIKDAPRIERYAQQALPSILQYGGKPLVVEDNAEVIEGQWHGSRTVVLEFESVEAAHTWYNSDEYQAVVGERHAAAESNAVIVGGLVMPG